MKINKQFLYRTLCVIHHTSFTIYDKASTLGDFDTKYIHW